MVGVARFGFKIALYVLVRRLLNFIFFFFECNDDFMSYRVTGWPATKSYHSSRFEMVMSYLDCIVHRRGKESRRWVDPSRHWVVSRRACELVPRYVGRE